MNAIQLSNLTKYYGKSRGILNLNLDVKEGEFFGFIGPNGAGKSTTIRTLLGLITPLSGQAKIFDETIRQRNPQIRSHIGYLPSEAVFYRGMKVKDLLKLSADLHHKDCSAEREILCRRLQLDVNRKVDELSFGNRKKVAIVSALQHQPKLLILDEPTSGLDPLMQREFFQIIRERNEQGATVFLSSMSSQKFNGIVREPRSSEKGGSLPVTVWRRFLKQMPSGSAYRDRYRLILWKKFVT